MKRKITIEKSRLMPPVDLCELWKSHSVNGIKLDYAEYEFVLTEGGKIVLFDAYTASRRYAALDIECGVLVFPFSFTCMTDSGERVAYCGLRFTEDEITDWRAASECGAKGLLRLAADPDALAVHVPSGVCVLSGVPAYQEYESHIKDEIHPLAGSIILNGQTHTVVQLFGHKYAVFSTGWGDGAYKCYRGLSADGKLVAIIADFGMIEPQSNYAPKGVVEFEIESDDGDFIIDPTKSEQENNIERWTRVIERTTEPEEMLRAYSRRGYAYHSMNKTYEALCDYEAAINCCVHVSDRTALVGAWSVFDNAAELFCANNDYESAIKTMRLALSVGDDFYSGAYVRLVDLYLTTKRYDHAYETAKKMLEKRAYDPVSYMKYAEACVATSDYEQAAAAFETLASSFLIYENLFDEAACLIEAGDYARAADALERHPTKEFNEQYWYYKAYIAFKRRMYTRAVDFALKAHDIDPEYMPALYLLIDIKTLLHDFHAVARFAEEYKKARPASEYGFCVCAEAHLITGNVSESAKNYCYLYSEIVQNDMYAALAVVALGRTGDTKRAAAIAKKLKRKRSPYYPCVCFVRYALKYHDKSVPSLARALFGHKIDSEFLCLLATLFAELGITEQARMIMNEIINRDASADTVAAQVRVALASGDYASAKRNFAFYVDAFLGDVESSEIEKTAEGFASACKLDFETVKRAIL